MSDRRISTGTLTGIADAIRAKTGGSALITPQDMATEIASIQTGGGEDLLEKRITNTLTEYRNTKTLSLVTSAFNGCSKLERIFLPNASSWVQSFYQNSSLVSAVIGTVYQYTFQSCSKLEVVDICLSGTIQAQGFSGCSKLATVIIRRSDAINSLNNVNAFNNTPFASDGTGGTIYVPQALISSYQSASNWSTILGYANNQILKIEGTIYATQYADGTALPT